MSKHDYKYVRTKEEFYQEIKKGRSFYTTKLFDKTRYQSLYDYVVRKNEADVHDLLIIGELLFSNENIGPKQQKQIFDIALKISEAQDPRGYNLLGKCYFYGKGVEKNKEIGVKHLQKAAELGEPEALFILGLTYSNVNNTISQSWFNKAENKMGLINTMCSLIYREVSTFSIQQKPSNLAFDLIKKAEDGDIDAQVSLALHRLKGDGIKQDIRDAHYMLSKASLKGSKTAKTYIEKYFENRLI